MTTLRFFMQAVCVLAVLATAFTVSAAEEAAELGPEYAAGQRMYHEGILPSGALMTALAFGGVVRSGADAACAGCHRRSGFGIAEGNFVIRPIAGPDLYQTRTVNPSTPRIAHQLGVPLRPAYDDAALAKAIRAGVDITGRPLKDIMPRYALSDADMKMLVAYLKKLSVAQAPGVSAEEIHLAVVIQPSVPEVKRRAMLDVLHAFIRDKNAGVRSDEHRRTAGGMRMHRAYRTWTLHVWELEGTEESWGEQLQAHYHRQPVFAMVSGIGTRSWRPIHEFSEKFQVPCILPLTSLPVVNGKNFYTIYFSRGISLEADGLAKHLIERHDFRKIIQVYRHNDVGSIAAASFRSAMVQSDRHLEDIVFDDMTATEFWRNLVDSEEAAIVLWLGGKDLAAADLKRDNESVVLRPIYLSASLLNGMAAPVGMYLTYPWEVPSARAPKVLRTKYWLRSKGIESTEEEVQINVHFAIAIAGEALTHMMDSFSREYFVERVEHAVTTTLIPSYFPKLSLGPDQRFSSKGVYLVGPDSARNKDFNSAFDLIVP